MELMLEHLGKGFLTMLMITLPVVLTAASIGLVVGIIQAVTQVQEQTISAAPKIVGVFLVIVLMGGFFSGLLMDYLRESVHLATNVVTKQGKFVLPPMEDYRFKTSPAYPGMKAPPAMEQIINHPGKVPYSSTTSRIRSQNAKPTSFPSIVEQRKIYTGQ